VYHKVIFHNPTLWIFHNHHHVLLTAVTTAKALHRFFNSRSGKVLAFRSTLPTLLQKDVIRLRKSAMSDSLTESSLRVKKAAAWVLAGLLTRPAPLPAN
jgi:hypothetical protein